MDEFITILPANQEKQKRLRGIKTSRQESVPAGYLSDFEKVD